MNHLKLHTFFIIISVLLTVIAGPGNEEIVRAASSPSLEQGINDFNNENYEEAIGSLLKASKEAPSSVEAAFYTGLTFKELLNFSSAKTYLKKALTLKPELTEAFLPLAEVLYSLGEKRDAEKYLKMAHSKGAISARSSYLMGLILLEQKKNKEAVKNFQMATEQEPQSEAALLSGEALKSMGHKESQLALAVGYAFQYDDNVILKPSSEASIGTVSDEEDTRHVFTAGADYSTSRDDIGLRAGYSFYQSLHQDLDYMDVQAHSLLIMPSYAINRGTLYLLGSYDYYLIDNDKYLKMITLKPSWTFSTEQGNSINLFAGTTLKDFLQKPLSKDEERDGTNMNAGFALLFPFNSERSYVKIDYAYDSEDTDGKNWDYSGHRGGALLSHPLAPALELSLAANYYLQNYKSTHTTLGKKRKDKTSSIEAALTYSYRGIDFNVHYSYSDSSSSLAVYDYSRNIAGLGVNYTF